MTVVIITTNPKTGYRAASINGRPYYNIKPASWGRLARVCKRGNRQPFSYDGSASVTAKITL